MQLRLLVVVYPHEHYLASVFSQLCGIFLAFYLVDGSVGRVVEFQFYYKCRLRDIATRNHHEVGIALACGILAMDDILVLRPYIGYRQHTGKRVLVVIGEDARVLVVGKVDGACHGLLIAGYGGGKKIPGCCNRIY